MKNNVIIKALNELLAKLIILEQHQAYFTRNLFPRPNFKEKERNFKLSYYEAKFLFFIFDSLHNIPELIEHLFEIQNTDSLYFNEFLLDTVQKKLSILFSLIHSETIRKKYNIKKETNRMLTWIKTDLNALCHDIYQIFRQIIYLRYLINKKTIQNEIKGITAND